MKRLFRFLPGIFLFALAAIRSAGAFTAAETEQILSLSRPQAADSVEVLAHFGIIEPEPYQIPSVSAVPGMQREFRVVEVDSGEVYLCTAQVIYAGKSIIFWADLPILDQVTAEILEALRQFDEAILPAASEFFGETETDHPPVHALFTEKIGAGFSGYFSAQDLMPPQLWSASNGLEMFFLNPYGLFRGGAQAVTDTLSHELQHMIHYRFDRNEDVFIDEGLSGLSEYLSVHAYQDAAVRTWLKNPRVSLIHWPVLSGSSAAWYGSSFLFMEYLYERLGKEGIRAIVRNTENGLDGIDAALSELPGTPNADRLFQEWNTAILSELGGIEDSPFHYENYQLPSAGDEALTTLKSGKTIARETAQYGSDFFRVECPSETCTIHINAAGETQVTTLEGADPVYWTNAVNQSISTMTAHADLRNVELPVFSYDIDFRIENSFDFLYLLISEDNGTHWTPLQPRGSTENHGSDTQLGPAYSGNSHGLIHEEIDLSPWKGKEIDLQFCYVTDTSGIEDGAFLSGLDISGEPLNWEPNGYAHISNILPQHYLISFLTPAGEPQLIAFDGGNLSIPCREPFCLLSISPASRLSRSTGNYSITLSK